MGYRSQVVMAVCFPDEKTLQKVLSVYTMDKRVQQNDCMENWKIKQETHVVRTWAKDKETNPYYIMLLAPDSHWKWYEDYEDIQGYEHIETICHMFRDEDKDFAYAYKFVRVGEEIDDIAMDSNESDNPEGEAMQDYLMDVVFPTTGITNELAELEEIVLSGMHPTDEEVRVWSRKVSDTLTNNNNQTEKGEIK